MEILFHLPDRFGGPERLVQVCAKEPRKWAIHARSLVRSVETLVLVTQRSPNGLSPDIGHPLWGYARNGLTASAAHRV